MQTSKLTVRLPAKDIEIAKAYAKRHGISLTELINRYFQHIQGTFQESVHPEILKISGLIPPEVNVKNDYLESLEGKHA